MIRNLSVIINPAAGKGSAVLKDLNRVFTPAGIAWSVEVTLGEGDAYRRAKAIAAGGAEVVAVYGGDGTVSEAATALAGTQTALAILPSGTGNVLARELQIPRSLTRAAELLTRAFDSSSNPDSVQVRAVSSQPTLRSSRDGSPW